MYQLCSMYQLCIMKECPFSHNSPVRTWSNNLCSLLCFKLWVKNYFHVKSNWMIVATHPTVCSQGGSRQSPGVMAGYVFTSSSLFTGEPGQEEEEENYLKKIFKKKLVRHQMSLLNGSSSGHHYMCITT